MKANKFVKECGPYYVTSHSQGEGLVYARVFPSFPQYNLSEKRLSDNDVDPSWKAEPRWAIHRANKEGGGPSIFTAMGLADDLANFLNQPYQNEVAKKWEKLIFKILADKDKDIVFMKCPKCCYVTAAPRKWKFCPECGTGLKEE